MPPAATDRPLISLFASEAVPPLGILCSVNVTAPFVVLLMVHLSIIVFLPVLVYCVTSDVVSWVPLFRTALICVTAMVRHWLLCHRAPRAAPRHPQQPPARHMPPTLHRLPC